MLPLALSLLLALALAACGDEDDGGGGGSPATDAEVDEGGEADAGPAEDTGQPPVEDTGPPPEEDAGPPPVERGLCDPCGSDPETGDQFPCTEEGANCVMYWEGSTIGFCGQACGEGNPCPIGFGCSPELGQCVADNTGDCRSNSQGLPCRASTEEEVCKHWFSSCVRFGPGSFCTARCETDSDCPGFFSDCIDSADGNRYCMPDVVGRPDGCGAYEGQSTIGRPCRVGCEGDQVCSVEYVDQLEPTNPFCTWECDEDDDCELGSSCEDVSDGTGRICLPAECACLADRQPPDGGADLVAAAMGSAGLEECSAAFSWAWLLLSDPYKTDLFTELHDLPMTTPGRTRALIEEADEGAAALPDLFRAAAGWGGVHVSPRDVPDLPEPPAEGDLLGAALADLITTHGDEPDAEALAAAVAGVPGELKPSLALLVDAVSAAATARERAFEDLLTIPEEELDALYGLLATGDASLLAPEGYGQLVLAGIGNFPYRLLYLGGWDREGLYRAAADLLAAVQVVLDEWPADAATEGFGLDVETPIGRIVLADSGQTTHELSDDARVDERIVLLVDLGGDDTYLIPAGATTHWDHGVSLLLDMGGSDSYGYEAFPDQAGLDEGRLPSDEHGRADVDVDEVWEDWPAASLSTIGRQGSGRLGIGVLVDAGEEGDEYTSLKLSQAFSAVGVGVLADLGGDDSYTGEAGVQASAMGGVSVLYDAAGDDVYSAWTRAQGEAFSGGSALLYDRAGNDRYLAQAAAEETDPLYPASTEEGETPLTFSLAQGVGYGRYYGFETREDIPMAGGVGVLRDLAGDDEYRADVIAQGSGAWLGVGVLADAEGDDTRDGARFVQGAPTSFAVGVLLDDRGADTYNAGGRASEHTLGSGASYGVGVMVEGGGDDHYHAPDYSLGSGDANGYGLFIDVAGMDEYDAATASRALGFAEENMDAEEGDSRLVQPTVGLFIDAAGQDTYARRAAEEAGIGNDATWSVRGSGPFEMGAGVDGEGIVALDGVLDAPAEGEGEGEGEGE